MEQKILIFSKKNATTLHFKAFMYFKINFSLPNTCTQIKSTVKCIIEFFAKQNLY